MDVFTDVDLLCDLMEASNKRRVPVYILLDEKNLDSFTDMCTALDIQSSHMSNMRIRTTCGDTYCTKSGKKFSGQVLEKFLIIDCEEVIAGSYRESHCVYVIPCSAVKALSARCSCRQLLSSGDSAFVREPLISRFTSWRWTEIIYSKTADDDFTWLSAQVHSNMVMHFSGRITDSFDREFRCLYADSQIIDCFFNAEEEGLPYYPSYQAMMTPGGLRDRVCSENSSSQSSNSVSSVKAAPGMTSNTVYKVTQNHDKKESNSNPLLSPERRGLTPTPPGTRGLSNGGTHQDRPPPAYGQQMGIEWNKPNAVDVMRSNIGGASSKFQALGLYEQKPNMFQSPTTNFRTHTLSPVTDIKFAPKQRTPPNQFFNKLSDMFLPNSKETYNTRGSPSPLEIPPWGGPDLTMNEPESEQSLPPPPSHTVLMSRHDQKRLTLGHSKLDLVNQYNKMTRQVYSRFELKTSN
ncbi:hypothetical protein JOQ06_014914 [Pogonophryne albipinna]|uniref:Scaffolding anchor of CK1 domain-containing protein n=2 Tax=Notothenioidei TaxID=8205 RepID=A0AAD6FB87_9TELE|nr:hypothetical protein JOQ06_014914 [Pogonophryne albipinna]